MQTNKRQPNTLSESDAILDAPHCSVFGPSPSTGAQKCIGCSGWLLAEMQYWQGSSGPLCPHCWEYLNRLLPSSDMRLSQRQNIGIREKVSEFPTQTWPLSPVTVERLVRLFRRMFKADTARLSSPLGETIFLIIGFNRNTKDDSGQWFDQSGNVLNWDYVQESCIASGDTVSELIASAKRYKRLQSMTWNDFFRRTNNTYFTDGVPLGSGVGNVVPTDGRGERLFDEPSLNADSCDETSLYGDGKCGECGQLMRYNVPRLGPSGGYVHAHTGRLDCGGDNSPMTPERNIESLNKTSTDLAAVSVY